MRLKNPKKNCKEGAKENIWTTYYRFQAISIKLGVIGHGAFFKQCPKSNIVFLETFNGVERIELHKGGNIKPKVMNKFQVWEKNIH
jgi:hypothetical protein